MRASWPARYRLGIAVRTSAAKPIVSLVKDPLPRRAARRSLSRKWAGPSERSSLRARLRRDKYYLLLLAVPIVYFIVFKYLPIAGNVIAFRRYIPGLSIFGTQWVGLRYFALFLVDVRFWAALKNSFLLSVYSLLINFPIPILFALLLNEIRSRTGKRFVQTVSYLPRFISVVVVIGMVKEALSPSTGIVNRLLGQLGIAPIFFVNEPGWFRFLFISTDLWQFTGWSSIIYLAALANVDVEQYEAATIDGATRLQQVLHVTIPGIMPTIVITLVLNVGYLLTLGIEKVALLYTPNNSSVSDTLEYYVYRVGLLQSNYSYAAAAGLFSGILALILISSANYVSRKLSDTNLY